MQTNDQEPAPEPASPANPPASPGMVDENGIIANSLECARCAYQLRGLAQNGSCPECAYSVHQSLLGDPLFTSDSEHIAWLRSGARWLRVGLYLQVLAAVIELLVILLTSTDADPAESLYIACPPFALLSLVAPIGWWMIAARDPRMIGFPERGWSRRLSRIGSAVEAIAIVCAAIFFMVMLPFTIRFNSNWVILIPALVLGILLIVVYFARLRYLIALSRRLMQRELEIRAGQMMVIGPCVVVLGSLCGAAGPIGLAAFLLWTIAPLRQGLEQAAAARARLPATAPR